MITVHRHTLPNGLRTVAVPMPHLHSAEIAIYLKVGGRNDPPGKAGLAHFLEHMLFRGTTEHPTTLELETAFEAIGGAVNAATDEETTCYFSRVHPDRIAEGIRLFSSMLLRPTLIGLDVEKRIITEEALEDINEQGEDINTHNRASRLLWPGHPLGDPTIGYLETIEGFTREDLLGHLERFYTPDNAVLVVAGRISPGEVVTATEEAFGGWRGANPPEPSAPLAEQDKPQSLFVRDSDSQVHVLCAFRGFPRNDHRIMATRLVRRLLCGGGSSRLHLLLREKLGVVYSVDATISAYAETGSFAVEFSTAPDNLFRACDAVLAETRRLATEAVPADELERFRQGYLFDLDYSRDSTYEMQVRYGWGELLGIVKEIEEDREEVAAVDSNVIAAVAQELFAPGNLNLAVVGPWSAREKKRTEKLLEEYARKWERP